MALTARYGASLRRNETTIGAFHLLISSGVGADGVYEVCAGVYRSRRASVTSRSRVCFRASVEAAVDALVARVGIPPPSSATANAAALGKRSAGSFSRHIITARARSGGKSGHRSSTGIGFSDRCFTSIEGVLLA